MNAQQAIVGIYVLLDRGKEKNPVEKARKAARAAGFTFSNTEASAWLAPFLARHPNRATRGANGKFSGSRTDSRTEPMNGHLSTKRTDTADGQADPRTVIEPLVLISTDDSLRSSSRPAKPERARRVRQVPLDFNRELFDRRDAILKAAWQKIQPFIGRATTFSAWKTRNNAAAAVLAEKQIAPEVIVRAWDLATAERGEPLRELFMVQRFIERAAADAAQRRLAVSP